ncbi:MAG: GDP-L-fucose synthase [Actinobacteria bacterium]|nr:GDP-L-fucose synthase [Actinomycetota bacterium]
MSEVSWKPGPLDRGAKFYVAGHGGMVGAAIWRHLQASGFTNPDNLQIQVNVMDAAAKYKAERLLFMGSSCIYPKFAEQPIKEDSLLTGHLEPTNDAYAIAKIAGIMQVQATRRQYGLAWISAMPTNLYGVGDNYSGENSHVIPALIKRYEEARLSGAERVTNWGTGTPLREFLYVDDLASATLHLLEKYDGPQQVNVGTGTDLPIKEIAKLVANAVGYEGETDWDSSKPDGTPRKLLDVSKIKSFGWQPNIDLESGLKLAVADFRSKI